MGSQFLPADMDLQFSAGIAVMPTDSHDLAELLDLADKRLYSAKNRGRNRTVGPLAEKRV
jgi:GGDEF domain-containing protein